MNMIKRVFNFVRPYIFRYYVAFFCGGVVWMLIDVYVTKGIDASFVSACADMALVALALIAGIQAKKIWQDKFKEDSYGFAKKIYIKIRKSDSCFELLSSNFDKTRAYIDCYSRRVDIEPDYEFNGHLISPKDSHYTTIKGCSIWISEYTRILVLSINPLFKQYCNDLNDDLTNFQVVEGVLIKNQLIDIYFKKLSDVNLNLNNYVDLLGSFYSSFGISLLDSEEYDEKKYLDMAYEGDFSKVNDAFYKLTDSLNELKDVNSKVSNSSEGLTKYFKLQFRTD